MGNIQTSVTVLQEAGQQEVADTLKKLVETIAEEGAINEAKRREAVELVAALGEEVSKPEPSRKPSVIRAVASQIRDIIEPVSEVVRLYEGLKVAIRAVTSIELP